MNMSNKQNKNVPNVLHKRSKEREKHIGLNVLDYTVFLCVHLPSQKHPLCYFIKYF